MPAPGGSPQTLRQFLWRAEGLYPEAAIVSRAPDGTKRYGYARYGERAAKLADALDAGGYTDGGRVGTLCWNHHRHFETYFGVPCSGAQLHTINPLLPEHHLAHVVADAGDRLLFVDPSLLGTLEELVESHPEAVETVEQFVVTSDRVPETDLDPVLDYESFLGERGFDWPDLDSDRPAGLCYTSGTTGRPKGVEYTHRMLWSHTMGMLTPQGIPMTDSDVVMPVVPMFHVNAWGIPFTATAAGATQIYPGPRPEPETLASLIESEGVTVTAGVPAVWNGLVEYLQETAVDLSTLETVVVGGSAAPESLLRFFDGQDVEVLHAWGMTETSPMGAVAHLRGDLADADPETKLAKRTKQGLVPPGVEFRVVGEDGEPVPWDGTSIGELQVRGPWVTTTYHGEDGNDSFDGGYLRTGDVVTVDRDGYIEIVDRRADIIDSGGEWISSVELERALVEHGGIEAAAVVGVDSEEWGERPVAVVVPADGLDDVEGAVRSHLDGQYPEWWLPDETVAVESLPRTGTGKVDKEHLRATVDTETGPDGRTEPTEGGNGDAGRGENGSS